MFRFYISQAQAQSVIIPAGTRISFDGAILFETKEILEIKAGQTYGDVEGVCTTAGTVGNNLAAGQVKEIVDLYDYYQKAENITATSGGAEEEDDDSYYERMREYGEFQHSRSRKWLYLLHKVGVPSSCRRGGDKPGTLRGRRPGAFTEWSAGNGSGTERD